MSTVLRSLQAATAALRASPSCPPCLSTRRDAAGVAGSFGRTTAINITRVILTREFYPGINWHRTDGAKRVSNLISRPCTAFDGHRLLLSGPLVEVAFAVKAATASGSPDMILVFDDATGRVVDLDLRGTKADIVERLSQPPQSFVGRHRPRPIEAAEPERKTEPEQKDEISEPRGRGRPRLGVVAREITLLPRQWDWLAAQPGGASAVLRRLVDDARRNGAPRLQRRAAQEAAYRFMQAIAGDLPGYEEATRALFADDRTKLEQWIAEWPKDVRSYVLRLAFGAQDHTPSQ